MFFVSLTDVLEKTPQLVCCMLEYLFTNHLQSWVQDATSLDWSSDVGLHFRAYVLMWFWSYHLARMPATPHIKRRRMNFDAEHHGKGICDADGVCLCIMSKKQHCEK